MTLILCGLPKSGKSTIGKMVAKKLNWTFIDTDRLIEKAYAVKMKRNYTCRQIYIEEGETFFRELEKAQIVSLNAARNSIISVGGGSLADRENTQNLQLIGKLVYLNVPIDLIWNRIKRCQQPAYLNEENSEPAFYSLAKRRIPQYEEAAHYIIETGSLNKSALVDAVITIKETLYGK